MGVGVVDEVEVEVELGVEVDDVAAIDERYVSRSI